ncbi:10562_t:CDS:2 [Ambispora gerdemannii]|uniref:10562_t:CDS:1 n=1 Tax=Ambispora gerdemannii TaxID=144530 RepID=A0A9N8Z224_9GLOM|nr:10562_t:CDS:2 [Ambispora gerdemannii]
MSSLSYHASPLSSTSFFAFTSKSKEIFEFVTPDSNSNSDINSSRADFGAIDVIADPFTQIRDEEIFVAEEKRKSQFVTFFSNVIQKVAPKNLLKRRRNTCDSSEKPSIDQQQIYMTSPHQSILRSQQSLMTSSSLSSNYLSPIINLHINIYWSPKLKIKLSIFRHASFHEFRNTISSVLGYQIPNDSIILYHSTRILELEKKLMFAESNPAFVDYLVAEGKLQRVAIEDSWRCVMGWWRNQRGLVESSREKKISGMSKFNDSVVRMELTPKRRSQLAGFLVNVVELVWGELVTNEKNKLLKHLETFFSKVNFEETIVLLAICYIHKLKLKYNDLRSVFQNCELLLFIIVALLVSYKYLEDEQPNWKSLLSLLGISFEMIMKFEWLFMEMLDYKLHVTKEEFNKYVMYFKNKFNFLAQVKENPVAVCRPKNCRNQQPKGSNNSLFVNDPSVNLVRAVQIINNTRATLESKVFGLQGST